MPSTESLRRLSRRGIVSAQRRYAKGHRIIFFHVPKCGGTSVHQGLARAVTLRGFGALHLDPEASRIAADAVGDDLLAFRDRWLVYHAVQRRSHLIGGHFAYVPALADLAEDYHLVTLLREPRSQLLSQFFYNRDKARSDHFGIDPGVSLKEFLRSELALEVGANYVRTFTDPHLRAEARSPQALATALGNLERFDAVGALEHLGLWQARLSQILGRPVRFGHENPSPTAKSARAAEVDPEARALADRVCAPNAAVYEHALVLGRG